MALKWQLFLSRVRCDCEWLQLEMTFALWPKIILSSLFFSPVCSLLLLLFTYSTLLSVIFVGQSLLLPYLAKWAYVWWHCEDDNRRLNLVKKFIKGESQWRQRFCLLTVNYLSNLSTFKHRICRISYSPRTILHSIPFEVSRSLQTCRGGMKVGK